MIMKGEAYGNHEIYIFQKSLIFLIPIFLISLGKISR